MIERGEDIREFWGVLVRRSWVVYTVGGLVFALAALRTFTRQPLYRATTMIEIQRQGPNVTTFRDTSREDSTWQGYTAFYETQYRILQSRVVARLAAVELDLAHHPLLPAQTPGLLSRALSAVRSLLPHPETAAAPADPEDPYIALVLSRLEVEPIKDSNLVNISYSSPDPNFSAQLANAVADAYIRFTVSSVFDTTVEATDFLGRQAGELRKEVDLMEARLQTYREQRQILPAATAENIAVKGVTDIHTLFLQARAKRIQAESQWTAARQADPGSLPAVTGNPSIQQLQTDLNDLEIKRSEMLRTFKPGWPEVETLSRKIEGTRERLQEQTQLIARQAVDALESAYHEAMEEEKRIGGLLSEQENSAQQAGRDTLEYATLQSEIQRKRAVLDSIVQRQSETSVTSRLKDMATSNARIVDRALAPLSPVSPRPMIDLTVGLFVGLLLGIGAAFAVEAWDNTMRSPEEVERILALPTLARIPSASRDPEGSGPGAPGRAAVDLMSHFAPASPLAESFRDLRTALSLSSAGESPRIIAVTSTRPQEGKSTTALNLSIVLAQSGRRVLLVDSDLRRPRLHRALGVSQGAGLSAVLCGKARLDDAVLSTQIPGLSLLPSGPVPPNPAELLDSAIFDELLKWARSSDWETVVLDSAPLLTVADGAIVASKAEATLLVLEADRTTREEAKRAMEKVRQVSGRVIGVVLNNVADLGTGYYGRYHYRYHVAAQEEEARPGARAAGLRAVARLRGRWGR